MAPGLLENRWQQSSYLGVSSWVCFLLLASGRACYGVEPAVAACFARFEGCSLTEDGADGRLRVLFDRTSSAVGKFNFLKCQVFFSEDAKFVQ